MKLDHADANGYEYSRPRAGAWIETPARPAAPGQRLVAPARGRGLKLMFIFQPSIFLLSPPRGGVD